MIQFNGSKIKAIRYNGAYIQTVMQNGNVLFNKRPDNGAYIQTVDNELYTKDDYLNFFKSIKTVSILGSGVSQMVLSNFDESQITNLTKDYVNGYRTTVTFNTSENRNKYAVAYIKYGDSNVISVDIVDSTKVGSNNLLYSWGSKSGGQFVLIPAELVSNGVALITDNHQFVIAKSGAPGNGLNWYANGTLVSNATVATTTSKAREDLKGFENSQAFINQLGNSVSYAVGYCDQTKFPNGKGGYLPSCGELDLIWSHSSEVLQCLNAMASSININTAHWSSTQYDKDNAWQIYGTGKTVSNSNKSNLMQLRPVQKLDL